MQDITFFQISPDGGYRKDGSHFSSKESTFCGGVNTRLGFSSLGEDHTALIAFKRIICGPFHEATQCLFTRDIALNVNVNGKTERVWINIRSLSKRLMLSRREILDHYQEGRIEELLTQTLYKKSEIQIAHDLFKSREHLDTVDFYNDNDSYSPEGIDFSGERSVWKVDSFSLEEGRNIQRLFDPVSKRFFLMEPLLMEEEQVNLRSLTLCLRRENKKIEGLPLYIGLVRDMTQDSFQASALIGAYRETFCMLQESLTSKQILQGISQLLVGIDFLKKTGFSYVKIDPRDVLVKVENASTSFAFGNYQKLVSLSFIHEAIIGKDKREFKKSIFDFLGVDVNDENIKEDVKEIRKLLSDSSLVPPQKAGKILNVLKDIAVSNLVRGFVKEMFFKDSLMEESLEMWSLLWECVNGESKFAYELFVGTEFLKRDFSLFSALSLLALASPVREERPPLEDLTTLLKNENRTKHMQVDSYESFWEQFEGVLMASLSKVERSLADKAQKVFNCLSILRSNDCLDVFSLKIILNFLKSGVEVDYNQFCYYIKKNEETPGYKENLLKALRSVDFSGDGFEEICDNALSERVSKKKVQFSTDT
jgi:hypothetical protein